MFERQHTERLPAPGTERRRSGDLGPEVAVQPRPLSALPVNARLTSAFTRKQKCGLWDLDAAASVVASPESRAGRGGKLTIRPRRLAISATFIAAVLGSAVLSAAAQAAPGKLDPTFSGDGKQTTGFRISGSAANDVASGMAIQANGKIVVVGARATATGQTSASPSPATTRTAASTRPSPATAGRGPGSRLGGVPRRPVWRFRTTARSSSSASLMGARMTPPSPSPATTRTAPLDTSFSGDGRQKTYFFGSDQATGVAIQDDGKIVVVGDAVDSSRRRRLRRSPATTPTARLIRASPATASRRPTSADYAGANAVALQDDGKIVVAGSIGTGEPGLRLRLRPRPLQPERLARPELLRRRQADDRLRRLRRGRRRGDPG